MPGLWYLCNLWNAGKFAEILVFGIFALAFLLAFLHMRPAQKGIDAVGRSIHQLRHFVTPFCFRARPT